MKLVVQRSKESSVTVDKKIVGKINFGLVVLVGFTHTDTLDDIKHLAKKLVNLRIFDDENKVMNKSLLDVNGSILSISQFTLYDTPFTYVCGKWGSKTSETPHSSNSFFIFSY